MRPMDRRRFLHDTAALAALMAAIPVSRRGPRPAKTTRPQTSSPAVPMKSCAWRWSASTGGAWTTSRVWPPQERRPDHDDLRHRRERDRPGQEGTSRTTTAEPRSSTFRISAACSTTSRSTRSRSPRPTTGTPWPRSGPARRARTSTSRSRSATTSAKAGGWSRRRESTIGSSRPAPRSAATRASRTRWRSSSSGKLGKVYMAKGLCYKPRGSIGHKPDGPVPAGRRLQHLARPRARAAVQSQPVPLQLALVLGLRQRRPGQPGHPPDGRGPLGPGQEEFPKAVLASGGRFGYTDDGQTPNTLHVGFEFDDCELQFEVRGLLHQRRAEGQDRRHLLRHRGHPRHHQLHRLAGLLRAASSRKGPAAAAAATTSPTS